MQFIKHGIVNPEDLDLLRKTLENHCEKTGIESEEDREEAARLLLIMFEAGVKDEENLQAGLARSRRVPRATF